MTGRSSPVGGDALAQQATRRRSQDAAPSSTGQLSCPSSSPLIGAETLHRAYHWPLHYCFLPLPGLRCISKELLLSSSPTDSARRCYPPFLGRRNPAVPKGCQHLAPLRQAEPRKRQSRNALLSCRLPVAICYQGRGYNGRLPWSERGMSLTEVVMIMLGTLECGSPDAKDGQVIPSNQHHS